MIPRIVHTSLLSVLVLWKALVLLSVQFGSKMKVASSSSLIKADAAACWTTFSMCLLSYIGLQIEKPVICVDSAYVLEPSTLSLD